MRVKIGCEFVFDAPSPTPLVAQVQPRPDGAHGVLRERCELEPVVDSHEYLDAFGNRCWRLTVPAGRLTLRYDAEAEISPRPDPVVPEAAQVPVERLPDETLAFTLPSRYILSDLLSNVAWNLFGSSPAGWDRVQAICDWVHQHIEFRTASTTPTTTALDVYLQGYGEALKFCESRQLQTTALDVYLQGYGVCRDFAHLGVTMCRALNIPARYVFGYLPDIGLKPPDIPMDFHSWFEAFLGDRWYTFDARHNTPRIGRVPIGRGRDALDVALVTQYGPARLSKMSVWADELAEPSAAEVAGV